MECKARCEEHSECRAVDYKTSQQLCTWFYRPCDSPSKKDTASYTLDRGFGPRVQIYPLEWATLLHGGTCSKAIACIWTPISWTAGCLSNDEGIGMMSEEQSLSLVECQSACVARMRCAAVDFFKKSGRCILFQYACSKPLQDGEGVSSYRLERGLDTK